MPGPRAYLDYNATAPVRPEVAGAVADAMARGGNPSSVHAEGRAARARLDRAREQVAALVGAEPEDVIFTSGGTEASATALRPGALGGEGGPADRIALAGVEHPSVLEGHGFRPDRTDLVAVDRDGVMDLDALGNLMQRPGKWSFLVSLQLANSETGVLQPVAAAAALARAHGAALHTDAVQAAGRVPLDLRALGVDALTLSGHKLGAPPGTGALVLAPGRAGPALQLLRGGGQEGRRRAGTENVPGIVGFGLAAELAARDLAAETRRLRAVRDEAETTVRRVAPHATIFGEEAERLPNTLAFAVPDVPAETVLMALDLDGVAVSSGSACSSGKVGRSHVLAAMGVPSGLAAGAIRLSFGWSSTPDDVHRFGRSFEKLLARLYERGRARAA